MTTQAEKVLTFDPCAEEQTRTLIWFCFASSKVWSGVFFFSECGRRAPWEGCGTAKSGSGNSEAGRAVHPQGPGGNGVTLWENEVGKAPATEQLPQVGLFLARDDDAQLLFHCSFCILTTAPSLSPSNHPAVVVFFLIFTFVKLTPHSLTVDSRVTMVVWSLTCVHYLWQFECSFIVFVWPSTQLTQTRKTVFNYFITGSASGPRSLSYVLCPLVPLSV